MTARSRATRVVILGAAGRDFHNFNVVYRGDPTVEVVAFTATQIPGAAGRRYPSALSGARYPLGIPIIAESDFDALCRAQDVDAVVFAYSDVPHAHVMHLASRALAAGADFILLGPASTMLKARIPVIAVSAVRTGCGKSQTARWLSTLLRRHDLRLSVIRHPMPYGDLEYEAVQRFASRQDLVAARCTIEEREEYEPHLAAHNVVFAGVDYARILQQAQSDADLILWDGGNNDFPFIRPDLHIVLVDALRPGHETTHHPGEAVLRMADVIVVAKTDAAAAADVDRITETVHKVNPHAPIVRAASPIRLDNAPAVGGRRVLVVEDGPTTTHGDMPYGAGYVAATRAHAAAIIDPRPFAAPEIGMVYARFPHLGPILPAMGYTPGQLAALERTINATPAEIVVASTPIDLTALITINKPVIRARYEFSDASPDGLAAVVEAYLERSGLACREQ